ncbi:MAG: antirestriction protein ArdA [Cyanobacteria bacterium P01_F01_bin.150]
MTTEYEKSTIAESNIQKPEEENFSLASHSAIYAADLADYNSGILRGIWIPIFEDSDKYTIQDKIHEMLDEKDHEEYAIHDYNNIPSSELGEYPDLDDVIKVAKAVHQHGYNLIDQYINSFSIEDLKDLEDRFLGIYESVEDYAYEYINSCYKMEKMLGNLVHYFDYQSYGNDLILGGDIISINLSIDEVLILSPY